MSTDLPHISLELPWLGADYVSAGTTAQRFTQ